jgi:signal transduction histidine kinase
MGARAIVLAIRIGGLAAVVACVYALVVLGIGRVPTEDEWTLIAFSALAAAVCALAYASWRPRLDAFSNRLLRRDEASAGDLVTSFSSRAVRGLPAEELLLQLAESLRATLSLAQAEIWTNTSGILERAAADPPAEGRTLILDGAEEAAAARAGVVGRTWLGLWLPDVLLGLPGGPLRIAAMTHAGDLVGLIVVAREAGQSDLGAADDEVLTNLARQAALALHDLRLGSALEASTDELRRQAGELRESRARIVTAADAERRRIERDLHDGAQQHLIGLVVNLEVARELAATDPQQVPPVLDALSGEIHTALDELRDLAHGIYPPVLVDRGLREAIEAALVHARVQGGVDGDGTRRYPVDVEATVYFCCLEAIQNTAKHAGPDARIGVRIWEEDATLLFEIADDGSGFESRDRRGGVGVANMRDRVGALGGQLHIDSAPSRGTRVIGGVPL